jgi:hypothetical protein
MQGLVQGEERQGLGLKFLQFFIRPILPASIKARSDGARASACNGWSACPFTITTMAALPGWQRRSFFVVLGWNRARW